MRSPHHSAPARFSERHPGLFALLRSTGVRDAYWGVRRAIDVVKSYRDSAIRRWLHPVVHNLIHPVIRRRVHPLINWWNGVSLAARMEMHCVPRSEVAVAVSESGGRIVAHRGRSDDGWIPQLPLLGHEVRLPRLTLHWERLARRDPFFAVLTDVNKRFGGHDVDAFYQSGVEEIAAVLQRADERGIVVPRRRALDFGCGVGRADARARRTIRPLRRRRYLRVDAGRRAQTLPASRPLCLSSQRRRGSVAVRGWDVHLRLSRRWCFSTWRLG